MKIKNSISRFTRAYRVAVLSFFALFLSLNLNAQSHVSMAMVFVGSTATTADFDVVLTNDGTTLLNFNAIVLRANNASIASIATPGSTVTAIALNNNALPGWTIGGVVWPGISGNMSYNQNGATFKLNQSSNSQFFLSLAERPSLPAGVPVNIGRFRFVVANGTWIPNSQLGFAWHSAAGIVCSVNNAPTALTNLNTASLVSLSASPNQPLNAPTASTGVMSGNGGICVSGGSANISVAVTGAAGPYELVYTDGTSNFTVSGYASGAPISVSPTAASTTYTIVSINGSTAGHSGSATITVGATAPVVTSTPGSITNTMTWSAVGGAAYYYFEYRAVGATAWISAGTTAGTTRTIYGLYPNTNYELRARTHCANFSAGAWAMSTFSTNAGPACQTPPVASATGSVSSLTATWPATGASYYYVTYKASASTTWLPGGTTVGTSRTIYGLAPGSYDIRVRSHCADYSSGAWSNVATATVGALGIIATNDKPDNTNVGEKSLQAEAFTFETSMYPNPFGDVLHVELTSDDVETPVSIQVYDATGRLIESREVNLNNETSIDLGTNYAPGVYNVNVVQNGNNKTSRVIKR